MHPTLDRTLADRIRSDLAAFPAVARGDELDLVLSRRGRKVAIQAKASSAPSVTRGFWNALRDLDIRESYVVAPVSQGFPLGDGAEVVPLGDLLARL